jgi:hypothetical protein
MISPILEFSSLKIAAPSPTSLASYVGAIARPLLYSTSGALTR